MSEKSSTFAAEYGDLGKREGKTAIYGQCPKAGSDVGHDEKSYRCP